MNGMTKFRVTCVDCGRHHREHKDAPTLTPDPCTTEPEEASDE